MPLPSGTWETCKRRARAAREGIALAEGGRGGPGRKVALPILRLKARKAKGRASAASHSGLYDVRNALERLLLPRLARKAKQRKLFPLRRFPERERPAPRLP